MWNVFSLLLLKNLSSLCSFNYTWWLILVQPQRIFLHIPNQNWRNRGNIQFPSVIMGLFFFSNPSLTFPFEKLVLSRYSIPFVILYRGSRNFFFHPPIFNTKGVGWNMWHHADNVNLDLMGWFLIVKMSFKLVFV